MIEKEIETLPNQLKKEVLDFIGYLKKKTSEKRFKSEKLEWSKFSLANALRGMENEEGPEYSKADLKEKWS